MGLASADDSSATPVARECDTTCDDLGQRSSVWAGAARLAPSACDSLIQPPPREDGQRLHQQHHRRKDDARQNRKVRMNAMPALFQPPFQPKRDDSAQGQSGQAIAQPVDPEESPRQRCDKPDGKPGPGEARHGDCQGQGASRRCGSMPGWKRRPPRAECHRGKVEHLRVWPRGGANPPDHVLREACSGTADRDRSDDQDQCRPKGLKRFGRDGPASAAGECKARKKRQSDADGPGGIAELGHDAEDGDEGGVKQSCQVTHGCVGDDGNKEKTAEKAQDQGDRALPRQCARTRKAMRLHRRLRYDALQKIIARPGVFHGLPLQSRMSRVTSRPAPMARPVIVPAGRQPLIIANASASASRARITTAHAFG